MITTKIKMTTPPLIHTIDVINVTRDSKGAQTLSTQSDVSAYFEAGLQIMSQTPAGQPRSYDGFAIVDGDISVSVGDFIEEDSQRHQIQEIRHLRDPQGNSFLKELYF